MNRLWALALLSLFFPALADSQQSLRYGALAPFSDNPDLAGRIDQSSENVIRLSVTPGEYESASFYIQAKNNQQKLTLSVEELLSADAAIAGTAVDLKYVQYWYQAGGAWTTPYIKRKAGNRLVPELLVNDPELIVIDRVSKTNKIKTKNQGYITLTSKVKKGRHDLKDIVIEHAENLWPVELQKNEAKQLFLTIKVPENQKSGLYRGAIKIEAQDSQQMIAIEVDVLPFKLAASELLYSIYYRGKLKRGQIDISSEWKSEKQLELELQDMYRHGVYAPTMYQRFFPKHANEKLSLNIELFKQHLAIRKKVGIAQEQLFYLGYLAGDESSLRNLDSFGKRVKTINGVAKEAGVEKVYFYGLEERPAKSYQAQKPAWDLVREEHAGIFVALSKEFFSIAQPDYPDYLIFHGKTESKYADMAHKRGSQILSYANPQVGVENPVLYRRNYGFELIRDNYDGVMNYAYQDSMGLMWIDDDNKNYRDHAFTYPVSNGIVGTVAWEAFREAIDDSRYYFTLKKMVDDSALNDDRFSKARNFLINFLTDKNSNPDKDRAKIVSHILQIQKHQ